MAWGALKKLRDIKLSLRHSSYIADPPTETSDGEEPAKPPSNNGLGVVVQTRKPSSEINRETTDRNIPVKVPEPHLDKLNRLPVLNSEGNIAQDLNVYIYVPLPHQDSLRLILLHHGAPGDPLRCDITLAKLSDKPIYRAISYVWGTARARDEMSCGDKLIPLTSNLGKALRRIRSSTETITLWADAVCIEQCNVDERGHQVRLMGDIYQNAAEVLIHLKGAGIEDNKRMHQMVQLDEPADAVQHLSDDDYMQAWNLFWQEKWHKRVWTVQEVGLANVATLLYGNYEINWERLMEVSNHLNKSPVQFSLPYKGENIRELWITYSSKSRDRFGTANRSRDDHVRFLICIDIVSESRRSTDPRDLIYGLLAHPKAPDIHPDYTRTTADVYLDFANKWLAKYQSAVILNLASRNAGIGPPDDMPSWCPAWALRSATASPLLWSRRWDGFSASGKGAMFEFDLVGKRCLIKAFKFDQVGRFTEVINWSRSSHELYTHTLELSQLVAIGVQFSPNAIYADPFRAVCRALTGGSWVANEQESRYHLAQLSGWYESESTLFNTAGPNFPSLTPADLHYTSTMLMDRTKIYGDRRRLFTTNKGYIGIGPAAMRQGDLCVVIKGAKTPFVIRHLGENRYQLIEEAYIEGVMEGELVQDTTVFSDFEDIELI